MYFLAFLHFPTHEKYKYELILFMTSTNRNFSGLARNVREVAIGMSTKAKIVVGCAGVFVASATLFVVYDSLSEKTVRILVYSYRSIFFFTDHRKQRALCSWSIEFPLVSFI